MSLVDEINLVASLDWPFAFFFVLFFFRFRFLFFVFFVSLFQEEVNETIILKPFMLEHKVPVSDVNRGYGQ